MSGDYRKCKDLHGGWTFREGQLTLCFLPPYSPDLNPIERVWKLTRRLCTHNQYFSQLDELVAAVSRQLDVWRGPNTTLRKLYGIV